MNEHFGMKIFAAFTVLILVISFSFAYFFVSRQGEFLTDGLRRNGNLLAQVLAYNSRIGVFSENKEVLDAAAEGVLRQSGVLEVSIFNLEEPLMRKVRPGTIIPEESIVGDGLSDPKMFERVTGSFPPFHREGKDRAEFWSPVVSRLVFPGEEFLLLEEPPLQKRDRVIGFVRVTVDKGVLNERMNDLLLQSVLMGIIFLVISSGVTYLVVRGVTKPLDRLTEGVRALGREGVVEKLPVETRDEIGNLAAAFNSMSESLKGREGALRQSEQRYREFSEQLRKLADHLQSVREEERTNIAREIHDELGQNLTVLKMDLFWLAKKISSDQKPVLERIQATLTLIDMITKTVQRICAELRPGLLDDLGLVATIEWQAREFEKRTGAACMLSVCPEEIVLDDKLATTIFRIFQESLTNVARHAEATTVAVRLRERRGFLKLMVTDNGKGISPAEITDSRSFGLVGMRERVYPWGGKVRIKGFPNRGTAVLIVIPLKRRETSRISP